MDKVYLKQTFMQHKQFLRRIKSGQNIRNAVITSTDVEIDLLLKVLHLVGDGVIHVLKKHQEAVRKSKREKKLVELGSRTFFKQLMKKNRVAKVLIIKQFYSILPILIQALFTS